MKDYKGKFLSEATPEEQRKLQMLKEFYENTRPSLFNDEKHKHGTNDQELINNTSCPSTD